MKRIVREMTDWRVVGNEVLLVSGIHEPTRARITKFGEKIITAKELISGYEYQLLTDSGLHINSSTRVIEQITFDEAFKEANKKPISFIHENRIIWITEIQDNPEGKIYKTTTSDNKYINHDMTLEEEQIYFAVSDDLPFFQSDSWSAFYEQDLPSLIRMAREGV